MSWQPKGGELLRNRKPGLWSLPGSRIMRSGLSRFDDGDRYQHMLSEIDVEKPDPDPWPKACTCFPRSCSWWAKIVDQRGI
jgi:hypothetical protein